MKVLILDIPKRERCAFVYAKKKPKENITMSNGHIGKF